MDLLRELDTASEAVPVHSHEQWHSPTYCQQKLIQIIIPKICVKIYVKIYFKIMFSRLIRLYIAVLVCVLVISVYSVAIEPG